MKKILLVLLLTLLLLSPIFVSAKEAVYVVENRYTPRAEVMAILNDLGLSYDVVYSANLQNTNFSNYDMIIVNDDYFMNYAQIPINNLPALVMNGENICNWGWCKYISRSSQDSPISLDLTIHSTTSSFENKTIQAYRSSVPQIYSLQPSNIFTGIKTIAHMRGSATSVVVAYADKGDVLTKFGYPNTKVNAKTIFFGATQSEYWTNETKQLFKNSVSWILQKEQYTLNINSGTNLVSLPLLISSVPIIDLKASYPQIISVKTYENGNMVEANTIENQKGYFIAANSGFIFTLNGDQAFQQQTIELKQGMNLVGFNALRNISLNELPSQVIEVSKRNSNGEYQIATKYSSGWFNAFNLEPGKAYWIKASADVTWNYNP